MSHNQTTAGLISQPLVEDYRHPHPRHNQQVLTRSQLQWIAGNIIWNRAANRAVRLGSLGRGLLDRNDSDGVIRQTFRGKDAMWIGEAGASPNRGVYRWPRRS